ncbi:MAG TPA: ester cyclase [Candidatus Sulfotelmatobacter sp.]|nr:ester cyclase [Candidatus Sulfotelmatobacter sp.]
MARPPIRQRLDRPVDAAEVRRIRQLWVRHSIAEDRRDLEGLIATLTPDCVYQIVPTGQRWEGHPGARAFYTGFLAAFPDVRFDLRDIVIGPQGVFEVATMTGTHTGDWAGLAATGRAVRLWIGIHFPWRPEAGLFDGEDIYLDRLALADPTGGRTAG